jgi:hypothetical protein
LEKQFRAQQEEIAKLNRIKFDKKYAAVLHKTRLRMMKIIGKACLRYFIKIKYQARLNHAATNIQKHVRRRRARKVFIKLIERAMAVVYNNAHMTLIFHLMICVSRYRKRKARENEEMKNILDLSLSRREDLIALNQKKFLRQAQLEKMSTSTFKREAFFQSFGSSMKSVSKLKGKGQQ